MKSITFTWPVVPMERSILDTPEMCSNALQNIMQGVVVIIHGGIVLLLLFGIGLSTAEGRPYKQKGA